MNQVRCPKCNRMLGFFEGKGEIVCPRCRKKTIVCFNTERMKVEIKSLRVPV